MARRISISCSRSPGRDGRPDPRDARTAEGGVCRVAATPCASVTLIENTSTFYISPAVYRQYNMPHQREFVEIVKRAGKTARAAHVRVTFANCCR